MMVRKRIFFLSCVQEFLEKTFLFENDQIVKDSKTFGSMKSCK